MIFREQTSLPWFVLVTVLEEGLPPSWRLFSGVENHQTFCFNDFVRNHQSFYFWWFSLWSSSCNSNNNLWSTHKVNFGVRSPQTKIYLSVKVFSLQATISKRHMFLLFPSGRPFEVIQFCFCIKHQKECSAPAVFWLIYIYDMIWYIYGLT